LRDARRPRLRPRDDWGWMLRWLFAPNPPPARRPSRPDRIYLAPF